MKIKNKIDLFGLIIAFLILPVLMFAQSGATNKNGITAIEEGITKEAFWLGNSSRGTTADSEWMHYDDGDAQDSWGFMLGAAIYDVAIKWDPGDITAYDQWIITKIKFYVVNPDPTITLKIWEGSTPTEVYSQLVTSFSANTWTEIELDTPFEIDASTELWVGYEVDMPYGGAVVATDDGPPIDEYGNLYRYNNVWYSDFNNNNLQALFESNLVSDFEADATEICFGSTVNFTELATGETTYSWTFEGGTPSTSTDANPSVVYNTPGYYDVTLEVSSSTETATEVKEDYIAVLETPAKADTPDGEAGTCTGFYYQYTIPEVDYATDYEWELVPADAGVLIPDHNEASFEADETWTGDYTIKVRATNMCGDGEWSDELECTLSLSPEVYTLQGGGFYCLGEDGVEITLEDSQSGVDYELFLGSETTGIVVAGTGSEISFGLLTEEGYYEAVGFNDNCEAPMSTQIQVGIDYPPVEPATPVGPEVICNETTADYSTEEQDDADSFVWTLTPEEAGTIDGSGIDATVTWAADFSGTAYVSVSGMNDCGEGNPSTELEVSVGAPQPEVEGEDFVCDFQIEDYMVEEHDGSTYTWEVTGGTITAGDGTYMITVEWGAVGTGYVSVTEETSDGCAGDSEQFEVTIDACTGIDNMGEKAKVHVYPNPASGDVLNIRSDDNTELNVQIINSNGTVVIEFNFNGNSQQMDISSLNKGLYFVRVLKDQKQYNTTKLIIN